MLGQNCFQRQIVFAMTIPAIAVLEFEVLGTALLTMGFVVFVTGLLSDLISQNRQLNEIALEKLRELELGELKAPSGMSHPDAANRP